VPLDLYEAPDLYDVFMGEDPSATQLTFYDRLIERHGGPVLELACGTGRIAIPIAQRTHEIVGLDSSPAMLARAKQKAEALGVRIPWVHADMRSFELGQRFGFVFVAAQSFQHLLTRQDVEQALDHVRRHVAAGGAFLIQMFTPSAAILARAGEGSDPIPTSKGWYLDARSGRKFAASFRVVYDPATQVSVSNYDYRSDDGEAHGSFELTMRQFFPQEIDALLHYNGFDVVAKYGDVERTPFDQKSIYQHIVCRPR
jgi:ubiquinone/menaquinone biosynthesis C-methylase UbiE